MSIYVQHRPQTTSQPSPRRPPSPLPQPSLTSACCPPWPPPRYTCTRRSGASPLKAWTPFPRRSSSGPRSTSDAAPAYGIDIFSAADQTGNAPGATYKNAAAMGVIVGFARVFQAAYDGVGGMWHERRACFAFGLRHDVRDSAVSVVDCHEASVTYFAVCVLKNGGLFFFFEPQS